jgi:hypothetical protein
MNKTFKQCQADPTIKTVSVCFDQESNHGKKYTYKTRLDLKPGDLANVNTPRGVIVVRVTAVHAKPRVKADDEVELKWIASKVDLRAIRDAEKEDRDFAKSNPALDLL